MRSSPSTSSSSSPSRKTFSSHSQHDEPIPSSTLLQDLSSYTVYDSTGKPLPLFSILHSSSSPSSQQPSRVLLIFIRHFLCGNCQSYLIQLATQIPPSSLPPSTKIAIIGPGAASLIPSYIDITQCPYPIYADPSNQLYDRLGMHKSLSLGSRSPDYIKQSLLTGAVKSIRQGLQRVAKGDVHKAGDMSVNGGEFLFIRQVDGSSGAGSEEWRFSYNVQWCHRMKNSRDHTEISDLQTAISMSMADSRTGRQLEQVRRTTTDELSQQSSPAKSSSLTRRVSQRGKSMMRGMSLRRSKTTGAFTSSPHEGLQPSSSSSSPSSDSETSPARESRKPVFQTRPQSYHLKSGRHPTPLPLKVYENVMDDINTPTTMRTMSPMPLSAGGNGVGDFNMASPTAMV